MVENATRLTAAFCKSAITRSISESRRNLNAILSYFRSEGVGGKVEVIDNLCYQCSQPLGTGRTSLFRGKSYHEACFVCSKCRRNLNGVSFAIDRVTELVKKEGICLIFYLCYFLLSANLHQWMFWRCSNSSSSGDSQFGPRIFCRKDRRTLSSANCSFSRSSCCD